MDPDSEIELLESETEPPESHQDGNFEYQPTTFTPHNSWEPPSSGNLQVSPSNNFGYPLQPITTLPPETIAPWSQNQPTGGGIDNYNYANNYSNPQSQTHLEHSTTVAPTNPYDYMAGNLTGDMTEFSMTSHGDSVSAQMLQPWLQQASNINSNELFPSQSFYP
jgi:hypothetical protein